MLRRLSENSQIQLLLFDSRRGCRGKSPFSGRLVEGTQASEAESTTDDSVADPTAIETPVDSTSSGDTGNLAGYETETSESETGTVWSIATDSETFIGHRIGEELATIGTAEAVGRTSSVARTVEINGSIVESAAIEANLLDLESDDSRRDNTLQNRGLETATFVLTQPIDLGNELTDGAICSIVAAGDLTLHGVTQPVEVEMKAQYVNGSLVVVGSLEIELADYDITAPTTRIALAVDDHGMMEMQLILSRAG